MHDLLVRPVGFNLKPVDNGRERLTVDGTVRLLTVPASAIVGYCRLETAQIRFTLDTSDPTSTAGRVLEPGESLTLSGRGELTQFRAIRTGGTSGVLDVEYATADYVS